MNEIQKFKQGRKILKASGGTNITITRPKEESLGMYRRKVHNGKWTWRQYDGNMKFVPITREVTLDDGTILNINGSKSSIDARNAVKKTRRDVITSNRNPKDWRKEFTNFMGSLSSEQQEWLRRNGLQDATKLQEYLNNMKFDVGKFGADGKFGKDSKAAWGRFVASGIMGKNNDQEILNRQLEEQKKTEPVVDSPDPFGYKTSNTYEDADFVSKLKEMGIRSNADLMHFMYESEKPNWKGDEWTTQFRNDVDRLLGGDYSDDNIKKVFKTKNSWGIGFTGRGDFGDFQNVLQTNAGLWNGAHDQKESEARMDTARQQYATKLAQQFTPQLPKPTIEYPLNKFTIGKIQTNTLGNQPGMFGNLMSTTNQEGVV